MPPRIVLTSSVAAERNSASAFGSSLITWSPHFVIASTDSASCAGVLARTRLLELHRGGGHLGACLRRVILFQALLETSIAAVKRRDAQVEHVLRVAKDLERERQVRRIGRGVDEAGAELQLRRDVGRQRAAPDESRSTRTTAPTCRHPCSSQSFASFMSASERIGFFEKTWIQPPVPQPSRWKPLAFSRCSKHRRQLLLDGGFLLVALEEERHREDVERLVELGQAGGGEEAGAAASRAASS